MPLLFAATIGLPYFMLSTTGPLVQVWNAATLRGNGNIYSVSARICHEYRATWPKFVEFFTDIPSR